MAVHAHPDDEVQLDRWSARALRREGVRTVVVTCTDGPLRRRAGRAKPGDPGHDPEAVVAARRSELEAAAKVLGRRPTWSCSTIRTPG